MSYIHYKMMQKQAVLKSLLQQNDSKRLWRVWLLAGLCLLTSSLYANLLQHTEVRRFIDDMHHKHHFSRQKLNSWFSQVNFDQKVLDTMSRPAEAKPWSFYRHHLVSEKRIKGGTQFWQTHALALKKAEQQFGVPAEIIVAIIGIESYYGKQMGNFPVLQTLSTLAFNYPRRATFFKSELEQFLLLAREQSWDPRNIRGSYCGAMGRPQFMPSSYREYAIAFSHQPQADLIHKPEDAISSVAHFLKSHGWKPKQPIVEKAVLRHTRSLPQDKSITQLKPTLSVLTLNQLGIHPARKMNPSTTERFSLVVLNNEKSQEYWLGHYNFYVLTRYNRSVNYAMAVIELGKEIQSLRVHKDTVLQGAQL